jgi:hypothetical protein
VLFAKTNKAGGSLSFAEDRAPAIRKTNDRQAGRPSARNAAIVSSGER